MAADIAQLGSLVEHQVILQIGWAVRCQGLPESVNEAAHIYSGVLFSAEWQAGCCLQQICECGDS